MQSINNKIFDNFMEAVLDNTERLKKRFENVSTQFLTDKNKHFLKFESETTKIECEIIVNVVDEKLNVEIVHSKLLKLFIKNTTRKECVFNFKKNFVINKWQDKQIYDQIQVVFAYLNLMDNLNKHKNMN